MAWRTILSKSHLEVWAPKKFPYPNWKEVKLVHHSVRERNPAQFYFGGLHYPADLRRMCGKAEWGALGQQSYNSSLWAWEKRCRLTGFHQWLFLAVENVSSWFPVPPSGLFVFSVASLHPSAFSYNKNIMEDLYEEWCKADAYETSRYRCECFLALMGEFCFSTLPLHAPTMQLPLTLYVAAPHLYAAWENGMELHQWRSVWGLGKDSASENEGHGTGFPGQWHSPRLPEFKEYLDTTFRHRVLLQCLGV